MKTTYLLFLLSLIITDSVFSQDYFVIIEKNDEITYNYPENVTMNLFDEEGDMTTIEKDDAIDVTGHYTLKIEVPWRDEPEIIKSDGGRLEIFNLRTDIREKDYINKWNATYVQEDKKGLNKTPRLERREVFKSEINPDEYNLLVTFKNSITVRIFEGEARAWQDNQEIEVENHYLVQTNEGLLKLSFNKKTGETWWVWE